LVINQTEMSAISKVGLHRDNTHQSLVSSGSCGNVKHALAPVNVILDVTLGTGSSYKLRCETNGCVTSILNCK
jgi:hypothetical protein